MTDQELIRVIRQQADECSMQFQSYEPEKNIPEVQERLKAIKSLAGLLDDKEFEVKEVRSPRELAELYKKEASNRKDLNSYNVDIGWEESHGGTVTINAKSKKEAREKARNNIYQYQNLIRNKYGEETYNELHMLEVLGTRVTKDTDNPDDVA